MASVNKVILVGNLGRDPEVKYNSEGSAICNISIATTSSWKDKTTGEKREETEWHRVVFYNRLAEIAGEYLRKGRPVYVEGRLRTRKWTGQDGQERFTTEVIADQMQMLGGRDEQPQQEQQPRQAPQQQQQAPRQQPNAYEQQSRGGGLTEPDDIPFNQMGGRKGHYL